MDVYVFINGFKEDSKNNKLFNEIKELILMRKEIKFKELILDILFFLDDFCFKLRVKCFYGNIFEDMVLKMIIDNCNCSFFVVGSNDEDVKKKVFKNYQDF